MCLNSDILIVDLMDLDLMENRFSMAIMECPVMWLNLIHKILTRYCLLSSRVWFESDFFSMNFLIRNLIETGLMLSSNFF
jgi:hypothetical protein